MTERRDQPKPQTADAPRVGGPRAIADLMPAIGGAAFRRFGFVQSSLVSRWTEIVGERIARLTAPQSLRFPAGRKAEGTLLLFVADGHATMVQHVIPEIVERVNRFFGYAAVARVALRQGEFEVREPETRPPPRTLKPIPVELGDGLRAIGDPELRAVLEEMARGLAGPAPMPIGKVR